MKRCRYCNEEKPESEYHGAHRLKDGLANKCKDCCVIYQRNYRNAIRDGRRIASRRAKRPPAPIDPDRPNDTNDPILQPGGWRRCVTCWGKVAERDPRIIRCARKECVRVQQALGDTRTSPKRSFQAIIEAEADER